MPRRDRPDRDQAYVEDIQDSARAIDLYLSGQTLGSFSGNQMLVDAIIRRLGIIGEASACLSQVYKSAHPQVAWKDIVALRNLVVHHYWVIDVGKIWIYATVDVPDLLKQL